MCRKIQCDKESWQIFVFLGELNKTWVKIFGFDSSKLQTNYTIDYYYYLYLIFHTRATRLDMTRNLKNFANFFTK